MGVMQGSISTVMITLLLFINVILRARQSLIDRWVSSKIVCASRCM